MSEVRTILLTHQGPDCVDRMLRYWDGFTARQSVFLAFGGSRQDFEQLKHQNRGYIDSPRLRTGDHQREKQGYGPVFQAAAAWLKTQKCEFVHLMEYDHLPLVEDIHHRMAEFMEREQCDLAGFHVSQVDRSSNAHYLQHKADPGFLPFWQAISVRSEKGTVLTMFGSGSFWRKEAFLAVAQLQEVIPVYLELFQPTAAHHLGFRVRNFREQSRFVQNLGDLSGQLNKLKAEGAWSAHPVKEFWKGSQFAVQRRDHFHE